MTKKLSDIDVHSFKSFLKMASTLSKVTDKCYPDMKKEMACNQYYKYAIYYPKSGVMAWTNRYQLVYGKYTDGDWQSEFGEIYGKMLTIPEVRRLDGQCVLLPLEDKILRSMSYTAVKGWLLSSELRTGTVGYAEYNKVTPMISDLSWESYAILSKLWSEGYVKAPSPFFHYYKSAINPCVVIPLSHTLQFVTYTTSAPDSRIENYTDKYMFCEWEDMTVE